MPGRRHWLWPTRKGQDSNARQPALHNVQTKLSSTLGGRGRPERRNSDTRAVLHFPCTDLRMRVAPGSDADLNAATPTPSPSCTSWRTLAYSVRNLTCLMFYVINI